MARKPEEFTLIVDESIDSVHDRPFLKREVCQRVSHKIGIQPGFFSGTVLSLIEEGVRGRVNKRLRRKVMVGPRRVRKYVALSADRDAEWIHFAVCDDPETVLQVADLRGDLKEEVGLTETELRVIHELMAEERRKGRVLSVVEVAAELEMVG